MSAVVDVTKRRPAKRKGGRNSKPIFIPTHVLPQIIQSAPKIRVGAFDCKCLASSVGLIGETLLRIAMSV